MCGPCLLEFRGWSYCSMMCSTTHLSAHSWKVVCMRLDFWEVFYRFPHCSQYVCTRIWITQISQDCFYSFPYTVWLVTPSRLTQLHTYLCIMRIWNSFRIKGINFVLLLLLLRGAEVSTHSTGFSPHCLTTTSTAVKTYPTTYVHTYNEDLSFFRAKGINFVLLLLLLRGAEVFYSQHWIFPTV